MAKEANILQRIFEKSWNCYDERFTNVFNEVAAIYEWMDQVFPAAENAINRKTACNLPKMPHIKRRKLDKPLGKTLEPDKIVSTSDDNTESEIVEAKRPRQLRPRRNAKAKNRRSSKANNSKQCQKKVVAQVARPTRLTRASYREDTIAKSGLAQDICTNEGIHLKDEEIPDATESNTTKSFVEHEKDIECTDELKEITLKCFSVSLDDVLIDCNGKTEEIENLVSSSNTDEHIKEKAANVLSAENSTQVANVEKDQCKEDLAKEKEPNEVQADKNPMEVVINRVGDKTEDTLNYEKSEIVSNAQKMYVDDKNEKTEDRSACRTVENSKEEIQKDSKPRNNVDSNACSQGQIAKIKERLFEKIQLPSSSTPTRQSPRLMAGRQSPRLMAGRQSPRLMAGGQSAQLGKSPLRFETSWMMNSVEVNKKLMEQKTLDDEMDVVSTEFPKDEDNHEGRSEHGNNEEENLKTDDNNEKPLNSMGPKIVKPIKPKNLLTGVHTMIKAANQRNNAIHQGAVAKQGNIVTGLFSFIKPSTAEKKPETVQERKQRMEDEAKKREQARMRLIQQAEQRRQKEIEERKKRRQEREQRVAELQAKKAQEEREKQEQTQKRFEMMKKNEEKIRKNKEKEEELKRKIRERKMAEAEAKRKQEENERLAKMAEKEEEEKRKAEYQQRKQEYEEMERKKKIEEQKKVEEQRYEEHAREMQLQEERLRREIEEREALVRKRLEEKERDMKEMQERKRMEKERQDKEEQERLKKEEQERLKREEQEQLKKEEQERLKKLEQERLKREEQERLKKELLEREKAKREQAEKELQEKIKRENELKENERKIKERETKQRELKERHEKELKAINDIKIKEREAYYRKKLEQRQFGEPKRTFDKADLEIRPPIMKSPSQPAPHAAQQKGQKVQCTSYNTPTLNRATGQKIRSPSLQNYDINSLSEDDSTDDEEDPAQEIPGWAKGTNFKRAILAQIHSKMDPREIFINMLDPPKLEKMFPKLRARFFKRTSSACWDHPPRPFNTMLH